MRITRTSLQNKLRQINEITGQGYVLEFQPDYGYRVVILLDGGRLIRPVSDYMKGTEMDAWIIGYYQACHVLINNK